MDPSATFPNELRTISEDMEVDINEVEELRVCLVYHYLQNFEVLNWMLVILSFRRSDEEPLESCTGVFGDLKSSQLKKSTHQLNRKPS